MIWNIVSKTFNDSRKKKIKLHELRQPNEYEIKCFHFSNTETAKYNETRNTFMKYLAGKVNGSHFRNV